MSQRRLGAASRLSMAYISRIEANDRNPSDKALPRIASALGTTAHYLKTGEHIEPSKKRELQIADAELALRLGRDFHKAEATLHALIAEEIDDDADARAHAALGMLAAEREENDQAIRCLKAAAQSPHIRPETRPDVFETLAAAYVAAGEPWKAVAVLDECVEAVTKRTPEDATLNVRYRSLLGTTYSSFGEVDRARAMLLEATERAEGYDIPSARVFLYWSCARFEWMENRSDEALRYMALARAVLEVLGDTLQLARAHLVSGQICTLDNRLDDGAAHLEQAERLLVMAGEQDDMGLLRAEQAKIEAKRGDPAKALVFGRAAVASLRDDVRYAPTAWHALGLAEAANDDIDAAEAAFSNAVEGLAHLRQWRQASQAARDWGNALRAAGREADAHNLFERALLLTLRENPMDSR